MSLTAEERDTVAAYGSYAERWGADHDVPGYWADALAAFSAVMPPGGSVLELGYGSGRDAEELVKVGFRYMGVDVTPEFAHLTARRCPEAHVIVADPYKLPFTREFDGFWSVATLLHTPPPRMPEVLRSIAGALKPGAPGLIGLKPGFPGEHANDEGRFWHYWDSGEFQRLLESQGWHVLRVWHRRLRPVDGKRGWMCYLVRTPWDGGAG